VSRFLDIALRNAGRGFRVMPLRGKEAFLKDWPHVATTDETQIRKWGAKFPDYNVGVAGGPDVAIVDSDRVSRLKELSGEHAAEWFKTYSVSSGRPDRAHFYYLTTDEVREFGNKKWAEAGIVGNVFEVKVQGGQVAAEGSIHPLTGNVYTITQDLPLIPFPVGLMALMRECYGKDNSEPRERMPREKIGEGGRHDALVKEAGRILRVTEMSKPVLTAHLQDFNEEWLEPPLDGGEVERIALSCNWQPEPEPPTVIIGSSKPVTDWRERYLTFEQVRDAKPVSFLIDGFLALDSITALAAPVGQRKSLIALNVAHALCTGQPLFDYFTVSKQPERVVYLCPEMGLSSFSTRLKNIGLLDYVGKNLFCQTMDDESVKLAELDGELPGAVVILDTLTRFVDGDQNSSEDMSRVAKEAFRLKRLGATVLLLHHSIKGAGNSTALTLDSALRGSTEIAAFVTSCWATRLTNDAQPYQSPSLLVNVKQRDFESKPFEVTSGPDCRLHIVGEPGQITEIKKQKDVDAEKVLAAILQQSPNMGVNKIRDALKDAGFRKGAKWVGKKRAELMGTGVTTRAA
jgi:hypothetical protein